MASVYKPTSQGIKRRPQHKGCIRIEISNDPPELPALRAGMNGGTYDMKRVMTRTDLEAKDGIEF